MAFPRVNTLPHLLTVPVEVVSLKVHTINRTVLKHLPPQALLHVAASLSSASVGAGITGASLGRGTGEAERDVPGPSWLALVLREADATTGLMPVGEKTGRAGEGGGAVSLQSESKWSEGEERSWWEFLD